VVSLLCWWRCKWRHVCNATWDTGQIEFGLYQCLRCRTLSIGSPRAMAVVEVE
jgi:hypothetical protein